MGRWPVALYCAGYRCEEWSPADEWRARLAHHAFAIREILGGYIADDPTDDL